MALLIAKRGGIRTNNTTIAEDGVVVRVTLHRTVIFTLDRNARTVTLCTGGWCTPTTMRRMNECLYHYGVRRASGTNVGMSDFRNGDTLSWNY
jgi:hypothetical protein